MREVLPTLARGGKRLSVEPPMYELNSHDLPTIAQDDNLSRESDLPSSDNFDQRRTLSRTRPIMKRSGREGEDFGRGQ